MARYSVIVTLYFVPTFREDNQDKQMSMSIVILYSTSRQKTNALNTLVSGKDGLQSCVKPITI